MRGQFAKAPALARRVVELLVGERVEAVGPDPGEPGEAAAGLVEILGGEGGAVRFRGDQGGVPVVGLRLLPASRASSSARWSTRWSATRRIALCGV